MDQHWSDCATNNEPAEPNGHCNCGGIGEAYKVAQRELKNMTRKELEILRSHIEIELK